MAGGPIIILLLLLGLLLTAQPAAARTISCGQVNTTFKPVGEGDARAIYATRITCARARRVAHDCLHGNGRGWTVLIQPRTDRNYAYRRTIMKRANAIVSFEIVGGGGCG